MCGRGQIASVIVNQFTPRVKPYPSTYFTDRFKDNSGAPLWAPVTTAQAYCLTRAWARLRFATERRRTGLHETEKREVSGRRQGSKALAPLLTAVRRDGSVTSRVFGEEGQSRAKTFQLPPTTRWQPKACDPLDVCLSLALPGERADETERGKGRKYCQGNQKQKRVRCSLDQLYSTKSSLAGIVRASHTARKFRVLELEATIFLIL